MIYFYTQKAMPLIPLNGDRHSAFILHALFAFVIFIYKKEVYL